MNWAFIRAILILPVNAIIIVPLVLIWASAGTDFAARPVPLISPAFIVVLLSSLGGLTLGFWTARDFVTKGEGTPAPWNPPKKFVLSGPYRYLRNPMISGVFLMLFAEALYFRSWPIAGWLGFFILANLFYIPRFEEPALEKRFGDAYHTFKENVPRWIPRLTPWRGN